MNPRRRIQAENSKRGEWTKVKQLRRADMDALERLNQATRASMRLGPEAAPSTCVSIDPPDQTNQGTNRMEAEREWGKLVRRLTLIDQAHFKPYKNDRCYQRTLKFSTTQRAKQARDRI